MVISANTHEGPKAYFFGVMATFALVGSRVLRDADVAHRNAADVLLFLSGFALLHTFGSWAMSQGRSWWSGALPVMVTTVFITAAVFGAG
jgi:hypothetical protein